MPNRTLPLIVNLESLQFQITLLIKISDADTAVYRHVRPFIACRFERTLGSIVPRNRWSIQSNIDRITLVRATYTCPRCLIYVDREIQTVPGDPSRGLDRGGREKSDGLSFTQLRRAKLRELVGPDWLNRSKASKGLHATVSLPIGNFDNLTRPIRFHRAAAFPLARNTPE